MRWRRMRLLSLSLLGINISVGRQNTWLFGRMMFSMDGGLVVFHRWTFDDQLLAGFIAHTGVRWKRRVFFATRNWTFPIFR